MPRVNIYFTENILDELRKYIHQTYGGHKAMSLTVQQAIKEFLERKQGNEGQNKAGPVNFTASAKTVGSNGRMRESDGRKRSFIPSS